MTRVEAVAAAFCLPAHDVERWPSPLVDIFHRQAIRAGYLMSEENAA